MDYGPGDRTGKLKAEMLKSESRMRINTWIGRKEGKGDGQAQLDWSAEHCLVGAGNWLRLDLAGFSAIGWGCPATWKEAAARCRAC